MVNGWTMGRAWVMERRKIWREREFQAKKKFIDGFLFYLSSGTGERLPFPVGPENPFAIDRGIEAEPLSEPLESSMATGSVGMQKVAISRNDASR